MTNIIQQAAQCNDRDQAAAMVMSALDITETRVAERMLSTQQYWKRMPYEARLTEIGNWLRAECFERMELTSAESPMSLAGTND